VHETQYALKVQGPKFGTWRTNFESIFVLKLIAHLF